MSKIYLPVEDFSSYACYSIYSGDVIRAYVSIPSINSSSDYTDYFINSHYLEKTGTQNWSNYATLPECISTDRLTNIYAYRNDFADILVIAVILIGFVWILINSMIKTLLKGRKRY